MLCETCDLVTLLQGQCDPGWDAAGSWQLTWTIYTSTLSCQQAGGSRPLLESPLLEASPVTIKGDSRGDLLGASDHMKGLSEGQGPHAEVLVRVPSWLRSTDLALEALRRSAPGAHFRPPFCTPRFLGKELWVSRLCSVSQENEEMDLPLPHSLFMSQISDFLNRSTPPYLPICPPITYTHHLFFHKQLMQIISRNDIDPEQGFT